ncbi:MAG: hypothetical protein AABY22_09415 [Nanoarchaeota archaeon]
MSKISIEKYKENLNKVHGSILVLDELTYFDTHTKAVFIDKDFGRFYAMPYSITNGRGHPDRKRKTLGDLNRLTEEQINNKLKRVNDKIKIRYETYKNSFSNSFFVDEEFGEWQALPVHVFRGKALHPKRSFMLRCKTNLKRYGVLNPSQNKNIYLKTARSSNNSFILNHWKTGKEIVCVGSYEKKCVEKWNREKEDFDWQIPFSMPNGRVYIVDAYLPRPNKYIEIKGYMRPIGKEKWEWFHENFPNSDLWSKSILKQKGIL